MRAVGKVNGVLVSSLLHEVGRQRRFGCVDGQMMSIRLSSGGDETTSEHQYRATQAQSINSLLCRHTRSHRRSRGGGTWGEGEILGRYTTTRANGPPFGKRHLCARGESQPSLHTAAVGEQQAGEHREHWEGIIAIHLQHKHVGHPVRRLDILHGVSQHQERREPLLLHR